MAISFGKADCKQQVINYSCILQGSLVFFYSIDAWFARKKKEEKKQPGLGEVLAAVDGLSPGWWSTVELLVVDGGGAGDSLQPLEKAEKQRWMLIASVVDVDC